MPAQDPPSPLRHLRRRTIAGVLLCAMAFIAFSAALRPPAQAQPLSEAMAAPQAEKGIVVRAVDNDPANLLWECGTRRVPFGNEEVDRLRCVSFRYQVPRGGVSSATLHVAIKPLGAEQDTDSLVVAIGQPYPDCGWAAGNMPGCITLHGGFKGGETSLDLDLMNIACDPSVQVSPEAQKLLRSQLQTGVLHLMLQDDTAVQSAQVVLNAGPAAFPCGTSARPDAGQPPKVQKSASASSFQRLVTGSSTAAGPDPIAVGVAAAAGVVPLALFALLNSLLSRSVSETTVAMADAASRAANSQAVAGPGRDAGTSAVRSGMRSSGSEKAAQGSTSRQAGEPGQEPWAGPRSPTGTSTQGTPRPETAAQQGHPSSTAPAPERSTVKPRLGPEEDEKLQKLLDKVKDKVEGLAEPKEEEAWRCANCSRSNPAQNKYCVHCGTRHAEGR